MTIANEIETIRYYLRDPKAEIWNNSLLFGLYTQAQNELQQQTNLLEGIFGVELPPEFQCSYTYDWEAGLVKGSNQYQCFRNQGNTFTFTYRWEVQQMYGVADPDVGDDDTYAYTHPWEAFVGNPNRPPSVPFPDDMQSVKEMFHNGIPILPISSKDMQQHDPSWNIRQGVPLAYYVDSDIENQFVLYGRPSSFTWTDDVGEGMVTSVSGDTTNSETGIFTISTGRSITTDDGMTIDVIDTDDNVLLIYDVAPPDIEGLSDEPYFPKFLQKYVRYRVLELAYMANTDGMNDELSQFWGERSQLGTEAIKRFRGHRYRDRSIRLRTHDESVGIRKIKKPRLPDTYPRH